MSARLSFDNDGPKVRLALGTDLKDDTNLWLYWNAQNDIAAEALARHLDELYRIAVAAIRREAYDRGWRDAKAKSRKQKHFSRCLG